MSLIGWAQTYNQPYPGGHWVTYSYRSPVVSWQGLIVLYHNSFSPSGEQPKQRLLISLEVRTTNCRLYSNISQILLLCKTWGYYNKFDIIKPFRGCYRYVKRKYHNAGTGIYWAWIRIYYVLCYYSAFRGLFWSPLVCDKPLEVPPFVKLAYCPDQAGAHTEWSL